jgi:hypothetical protein
LFRFLFAGLNLTPFFNPRTIIDNILRRSFATNERNGSAMKNKSAGKSPFGATFKPVNLTRFCKWPQGAVKGKWWKELASNVAKYPCRKAVIWGVPFSLGAKAKVALLKKGDEMVVPLTGQADYLCVLHQWLQLAGDIHMDKPAEGLVVGEYEIIYADGSKHVQPIRGRFEVEMVESPGLAWLALSRKIVQPVDFIHPKGEWGVAQTGCKMSGGQCPEGYPLLYAMPNPHPGKTLACLRIRALRKSPLLLAGLTLYSGSSHPLQHLPRRCYRVVSRGKAVDVAKAKVDMGVVARIEKGQIHDEKWLASPYRGVVCQNEPVKRQDLIHAFGAKDATLGVEIAGKKGKANFSLGEAFENGSAAEKSGAPMKLELLDGRHQWMRVVVKDAATGKPTPVRIHIATPSGQYVAPYGHHEEINPQWFMDYGADVIVGGVAFPWGATMGRNCAYVEGEFTTDMPVGDLCVEITKGFEYAPIRRKVTVHPGQDVLELTVDHNLNWRQKGFVTADTHVHFISPHTASLEAQGEGVNIVNLLASQWGRLFTNVGDIRGRANVIEDDTIVYVGTENRNHMLGHMSMLGTKGLPVYPMCCGGPSEAYLGDPDFMALAEWSLENRRRGGLVVRPHFPYCGNTEDPVSVIAGLVDALEIQYPNDSYPVQEWYRYLNCGYRVAIASGTDKMGAYCALGWTRTYAQMEPGKPLDYEDWAAAVRGGRTFATSGPLIDLSVEGKPVGSTIDMPAGGGTVEAHAYVQSVWPVGRIEIVQNGRVVASEIATAGRIATDSVGVYRLDVTAKVRVERTGWIAARCIGPDKQPSQPMAAHTSPVYVRCGDTRAFDGPAAEHMLALVEGSREYLNTIATSFDETSRRRMGKLFREAGEELRNRLIREGGYDPKLLSQPYKRMEHHHL